MPAKRESTGYTCPYREDETLTIIAMETDNSSNENTSLLRRPYARPLLGGIMVAGLALLVGKWARRR